LSLGWTLDQGTSELETGSNVALHNVFKAFYLLEDYNLETLLVGTIK
jgi:hypothetical protein